MISEVLNQKDFDFIILVIIICIMDFNEEVKEVMNIQVGNNLGVL